MSSVNIHIHTWGLKYALRGEVRVKMSIYVCVYVFGVELTVQEIDPRNHVGMSAAKTYLPHDYRLPCEPDTFFAYLCSD